MAIEFRCGKCSKLLRTSDETAGRQAQCPECGALSEIPSPGSPTGMSPPLPSPVGETSADAPGSPFGPGFPVDGAMGSNAPYQTTDPHTLHVMALERVSGPATALIVTGILSIILQTIGIVANLALTVIEIGPAAQDPELFFNPFGPGINAAFGVFSLAMAILVLVGAMKMKSLNSYGFVVASAIVAMIPCISPCCLLGFPFGIWALVVLSDSSVKAAFRS